MIFKMTKASSIWKQKQVVASKIHPVLLLLPKWLHCYWGRNNSVDFFNEIVYLAKQFTKILILRKGFPKIPTCLKKFVALNSNLPHTQFFVFLFENLVWMRYDDKNFQTTTFKNFNNEKLKTKRSNGVHNASNSLAIFKRFISTQKLTQP